MSGDQRSHQSSADDWERRWPAYDQSAQMNPAQKYRRKLRAQRKSRDARQGALRVLDLGCGQGDFLREVQQMYPNAQLAGLDFSEAGLTLARERVPGGRFVSADFSKPLTLPADLQGWATHVVCSEVLEHLDDPALLLSEIRDAISPGGKLVVTVPVGRARRSICTSAIAGITGPTA